MPTCYFVKKFLNRFMKAEVDSLGCQGLNPNLFFPYLQFPPPILVSPPITLNTFCVASCSRLFPSNTYMGGIHSVRLESLMRLFISLKQFTTFATVLYKEQIHLKSKKMPTLLSTLSCKEDFSLLSWNLMPRSWCFVLC